MLAVVPISEGEDSLKVSEDIVLNNIVDFIPTKKIHKIRRIEFRKSTDLNVTGFDFKCAVFISIKENTVIFESYKNV